MSIDFAAFAVTASEGVDRRRGAFGLLLKKHGLGAAFVDGGALLAAAAEAPQQRRPVVVEQQLAARRRIARREKAKERDGSRRRE